MRNLDIYGVRELNAREIRETEGGSIDPDGCSGCNAGKFVRAIISAAWSFNSWIGVAQPFN